MGKNQTFCSVNIIPHHNHVKVQRQSKKKNRLAAGVMTIGAELQAVKLTADSKNRKDKNSVEIVKPNFRFRIKKKYTVTDIVRPLHPTPRNFRTIRNARRNDNLNSTWMIAGFFLSDTLGRIQKFDKCKKYTSNVCTRKYVCNYKQFSKKYIEKERNKTGFD